MTKHKSKSSALRVSKRARKATTYTIPAYLINLLLIAFTPGERDEVSANALVDTIALELGRPYSSMAGHDRSERRRQRGEEAV
jgi:hypothetical protein